MSENDVSGRKCDGKCGRRLVLNKISWGRTEGLGGFRAFPLYFIRENSLKKGSPRDGKLNYKGIIITPIEQKQKKSKEKTIKQGKSVT